MTPYYQFTSNSTTFTGTSIIHVPFGFNDRIAEKSMVIERSTITEEQGGGGSGGGGSATTLVVKGCHLPLSI